MRNTVSPTAIVFLQFLKLSQSANEPWETLDVGTRARLDFNEKCNAFY